MTRLGSSRGTAIAITVVFMALITLPVAWSAWNGWRLDKVGVRTDAVVADTHGVPQEDPERFFVRYTLPQDAEERGGSYIAQVDRSAWEAARASQKIPATYLQGKPGVNRVDGQVTNRLGLWMTIVADLALAAMLVLAMKFRPVREKQLVLLAGADVVRTRLEAGVVDDGTEYVVRGEVVKIGDGEIVLYVGPDREVRVVLGEYRNPVGYQQPAEVRGRRIAL